MIKTLQKVSITTAVLGLSLTVSQINFAQAAIVNYNLSGTIEAGLLEGETFSGNFRFDDSLLINSDYETLNISQLEFNFLDSTFTQADADSVPSAEFFDGNFLGLSFSVSAFNPEFTLIPGSSDATDAVFSYIGSNDSGFGNIEYTVVPVPEHFSIIGTVIALGFGLLVTKKN